MRNRKKNYQKDNDGQIIKQQAQLNFNGTDKSYTNYDSYTFEQIEILKDKTIYLGFVVLKINKLLVYERYYDKLKPYFGEKNKQLVFTNFDSFVLSINTNDIIEHF